MHVQDIMTKNPVCCTPEMSLREVAQSMLERDCGEVPVIDGTSTGKLIGVITDRDITCRTLAQGKNPLKMKAREVMSSPIVTVAPEADLEECCRIMAQAQVRRIPVVDSQGRCCGIVSAADIARRAPEHDTAQVIREVSQPSGASSRVSERIH